MAEVSVPLPQLRPQATSLDVRRGNARLHGEGIDRRRIANAHGIVLDVDAEDAVHDPKARPSDFLAVAASATRRPLFSWWLGKLSVRNFGLLGYTTLNAPELGCVRARATDAAAEVLGVDTMPLLTPLRFSPRMLRSVTWTCRSQNTGILASAFGERI